MKYEVRVGGKSFLVEVKEVTPSTFEVSVNGKRVKLRFEPQELKVQAEKIAGNEIKAEISGTIVNVLVEEGERIKEGDPVLVLEAMKMENEVASPFNGVVAKIKVKEGDKVITGDSLIVISPD
jgi:methylmalonyl-CoA carboxyltransferase small subunit